jgi:hypothetical protein
MFIVAEKFHGDEAGKGKLIPSFEGKELKIRLFTGFRGFGFPLGRIL